MKRNDLRTVNTELRSSNSYFSPLTSKYLFNAQLEISGLILLIFLEVLINLL
jgi:hypothetical protein